MSLLLLFKGGVVPPPGVATAEYAPSIPQLGEAVNFHDTTTPVQSSWAWNFGVAATPSTSTRSSVSVVFNSLGPRTVTMRPQPVNSTWTQSITVVAVRPRLVNVQIGFQSTGNNSNPVMTDVSQYVRSVSISRGRQHELDRVEAGTCTIRLDNRTRQFDPTNTRSDFFYSGTGLLPMKRITVFASKGGVNYQLFSGFVEQWPRTRVGRTESEVEIVCVDAFVAFAAVDLAVDTFPQQTTGERVAQALSRSDWGSTKQIIDTPASGAEGFTVQQDLTRTAPTNISLLEFIQDVTDTELGRFFLDNRGNAVFHDANHRIRVAADRTTRGLPVSLGVFGDATAMLNVVNCLPYEDVVASYDVSEVRNWIQVTDGAGVARTVVDATSRTNYLTRTYTRDTQLAITADATSQASLLLNRYKLPALRFSTVVLNPYDHEGLWPYVLGVPNGAGINPDDYVDLGARVTVIEYPPGGGSSAPRIQRDVYVEAIEHDISGTNEWKTTWQLSPAENSGVIVADEFVIGTSQLNSTAVLGA